MKSIFLSFLTATILLGAGCARTQVSTPAQSGRLPDHITVVHGATLPQALFQARQDGKTSVRVSNPAGQVIEVTVNNPTSTKVQYTLVPNQDVKSSLQGRGVDTAKFYQEQLTESTGTFSVNITNHAEVATLIYELSVGYHSIRSTTDWVIDLL